ncbi:MAG: MBL fold metallo-hydrolase [Microbacterium sp.]
MKVTKHEHATLRLTEAGRTLIVDPGSLTAPLEDVGDLAGILLTHEHADHWTTEHLERLTAGAGDVPILGTEGVARAADGWPVRVVRPGETTTVGPFALEFFGGSHEVIHASLPVVDNVGVLVGGTFYYPGDSYALPRVPVELLAAPTGAPWLRLGDAMDFILDVAPRRAFGTHDATLSDVGRAMHRARMRWATEQGGGAFHDLEPGDALEV